jgi:hypothetical protein
MDGSAAQPRLGKFNDLHVVFPSPRMSELSYESVDGGEYMNPEARLFKRVRVVVTTL